VQHSLDLFWRVPSNITRITGLVLIAAMDPRQDVSTIEPDLPIPISCTSGHYLIFDIKAVSYLRRKHKMCGYNIGTLPQNPSQNLFLGLPIIIMPEEAQMLLENGIGYIIDDPRAHDEIVNSRDSSRSHEYLEKAHRQAKEVERMRTEQKDEATRRALSKQSSKRQNKSSSIDETSPLLYFDDQALTTPGKKAPSCLEADDTPFKLASDNLARSRTYHVTPTTSRLLTSSTLTKSNFKVKQITNLPSTYRLFAHLHHRGYYMTPGLRFGCQYAAYPDDPLRFHSHFLCVGCDWDEEIDLMEIVAGGRLGTGVKKGLLLGGAEPDRDVKGDEEEEERKVRTFSVEWAVM